MLLFQLTVIVVCQYIIKKLHHYGNQALTKKKQYLNMTTIFLQIEGKIMLNEPTVVEPKMVQSWCRAIYKIKILLNKFCVTKTCEINLSALKKRRKRDFCACNSITKFSETRFDFCLQRQSIHHFFLVHIELKATFDEILDLQRSFFAWGLIAWSERELAHPKYYPKDSYQLITCIHPKEQSDNRSTRFFL